jgi:hypothetical protein
MTVLRVLEADPRVPKFMTASTHRRDHESRRGRNQSDPNFDE